MQTQTPRKKVRRRKTTDPMQDTRRRIRDWQENDGDVDNLPPDLVDAMVHEGDNDLTDVAFCGSSWEAFCAGLSVGEATATEEARAAAVGENRTYRGPEALYATSKKHRRVLFLELMAWAISEAERYDLSEKVAEHRKRVWGNRPWSGVANEEEAYLAHVTAMARTFAGCDNAGGAWYPNRKHGPLAGQDL